MPYSYQLSQEAENDILQSYVWYKNQQVGLGEKFLLALDLARQTILDNPFTYKVAFKKRVRVFHLMDFPFSIYYDINENELNVLSILHSSRNP